MEGAGEGACSQQRAEWAGETGASGGLVAQMSGLYIRPSWRRARTEYLVTADRVLIGVMGPRLKLDLTVVPFVQMDDVVLKLHGESRGSIVFGPRYRRPGEPAAPRFELGPEAARVYRLIVQAQAQAVARWPIGPPPRLH